MSRTFPAGASAPWSRLGAGRPSAATTTPANHTAGGLLRRLLPFRFLGEQSTGQVPCAILRRNAGRAFRVRPDV